MSKVPGTFENGGGSQYVPPDLVWDEDNHPVIFQCSQHTTHAHDCDHKSCGEPIELDTESQVEVLNEGRRYARAGMSFMGVPAAYQNQIPIPGINVELVDLLMWNQALKQLMINYFNIEEIEFEEMFRAKKIEFLRDIREANENRVKEARLRSQLALAQKPGLLGPDGNPIG